MTRSHIPANARIDWSPRPRKTSAEREATRLEKKIATAEYAVRVYTESGDPQYLAEWQAKLDAARAEYAALFEAVA
jgi:hypothetical protein